MFPILSCQCGTTVNVTERDVYTVMTRGEISTVNFELHAQSGTCFVAHYLSNTKNKLR